MTTITKRDSLPWDGYNLPYDTDLSEISDRQRVVFSGPATVARKPPAKLSVDFSKADAETANDQAAPVAQASTMKRRLPVNSPVAKSAVSAEPARRSQTASISVTTNSQPARGGAMSMIVVTLVVICVAAYFGWGYFRGGDVAAPTWILADVKRGPFDHIVLEQGEIESSANVEIRCEVKSRNTGGTQILSVVPEGTHVKKGDLLVRLDASALERERDQQSIAVNTSRAIMIQAENTFEAAQIARQEYLEGTYKQEEQKANSEVFLAEQNLRTAQLSFKSGERLAAKGIVTSLQLEGDQFAVDKARNELDAAQTRLKVLQQYTKPKMLKQFDADIASAEAKWDSEKKSFALEEKKLKDITDQIAKCEVHAPQDGQVVYANIVSSRGGNSEFVVEAGANVREGQVIVRLPDPTLMQVKAKINESRITLVRAGMSVAVTLDALPDRTLSGQVTRVNQYAEPTSFFSSQTKEYATYIKILDPPPQIRPGLTASVQILVEHRDTATQIPVQATFEHGGKFYCLVVRGNSPIPDLREISIASTNEKFVAVQSGVNEGEKVVLDPRSHLANVKLPAVEAAAPKVAIVAPNAANSATPGAVAPASRGQLPPPGAGGNPGDGAPASAPGGGGSGRANMTPEQRFARLDANGDGKLSADELQAIPEQFRARTQQADTNGDGVVDRDEYLKLPPPNRSGGGGGGGPSSGGSFVPPGGAGGAP